MAWCTHIIVLVLLIIKCESVEIKGACPADMASKLRTNWLAMDGKWYEIMRESSPLQAKTKCNTIEITNVERFILVNHTYQNRLSESMSTPSLFKLSSDPIMKMSFGIGNAKLLTLMGTDYLNVAVFTYCTSKRRSRTNPTSAMIFRVYCRKNYLSPEVQSLVESLFKLRKADNMLDYLQYTDQSSCS